LRRRDCYRILENNISFDRVSYVEEQALRNLLEKFSANKSRLMKEFLIKDPNKTGKKNELYYHLQLIQRNEVDVIFR
jgi:hypothetical protein